MLIRPTFILPVLLLCVCMSCQNKTVEVNSVPGSSDWLGTKEQAGSESSIPIMAWWSIPQSFTSEERFQELKDAGFTISMSPYDGFEEAEKALNVAQKAGIKISLNCPSLLFSDPEGLANRFKDHPALESYHIYDEPNNNEQLFIDLGILASRIRSVDKNHWCYVNLLPGGKTNSVGGLSYLTYLRWYEKYIKPEIISFDNYPVRVSRTTGEIEIRKNWFDNLQTILEFSDSVNKPFWAFAMSVGHEIESITYPEPEIGHLRLQVFTNLVYGARGIQYFTYWTPKTDNENMITGNEYYFTGPVLPEGQKSLVYERVKKVNQEIKNLSPVFAHSTIEWIRHLGIEDQNTVTLLTNELTDTPIQKIEHEGGLIVALHKNVDINYLLIVNYELIDNRIKIVTSNQIQRILKSGAVIDAEQEVVVLPGDIVIYTWE